MKPILEETSSRQYAKEKTQWLFPVPLWKFGLPGCEDINKNIENRVYEKSKDGVQWVKASNEGGWHSGDMYNDPVMEPIIKFIKWGIKELSAESKMEYDGYNIVLWSNLSRPGDYNTVHDHPECQLSGVYYVKLPKGDCGMLRFYDPLSPYNLPRVEVMSKEGALLIFRAPILHDVTRNNTKEDRISLSFNVRFMRENEE